jgi:hypothetical protein
MRQTEQLTIRQTATGYWSVQRGGTHITGAMTRKGAEAEREMLRHLGSRRSRRIGTRYPNAARTQL